MLEIRVGGKYRLGKKIGKGSFGDVFLGINTQTHEEVAIKLEPTNTRHPQLSYESKLMKLFQEDEGMPSMIWFGSEGGFNVLIMELLGPSLEDLFTYCNRRFSLKTVLMIAEQLLTRVEVMHSKNFIHRDVKPDNFLIGLGEKSKTIFTIDFGLSKKFRDSKTLDHIPMKTGKSLTGTARYASIFTHQGIEQSRRDDIESIFYVLAYFLIGSLPWQGMPATTKTEKYNKIMEKKKIALSDSTYHDLPVEIFNVLNYARSLKFEDKPDYVYLKGLVRELMRKEEVCLDFIYDWTVRNYTTHITLSNKIIDDLRKGNVLNDSKQAAFESNHESGLKDGIIHGQTSDGAKGKCAVF
jgi:casein kinase 1